MDPKSGLNVRERLAAAAKSSLFLVALIAVLTGSTVLMAKLCIGPVLADLGGPSCRAGQGYCEKTKSCMPARCKAGSVWSSSSCGCVRSSSELEGREDRYQAALWHVRDGRFQDALALLLPLAKAGDADVLNMLGYAYRNVGKLDTGITYYRKALAVDPDLTLARAYLGEGYLQKGDVASARAELAEIASRCGTHCQEYRRLADAIAIYDVTGEAPPKAGERW